MTREWTDADQARMLQTSVAALVGRAVLEERERCAKIAEEWTVANVSTVRMAAQLIVKAIREVS